MLIVILSGDFKLFSQDKVIVVMAAAASPSDIPQEPAVIITHNGLINYR